MDGRMAGVPVDDYLRDTVVIVLLSVACLGPRAAV
jgi:hypothetical protein